MYQRLDDRHIRLIRLDAGQPNDPISCHLQNARLGPLLDYEALSYEWKQAQGDTPISCNDSSLNVTLNLASALRALRFASRPRTLWVDAICIDQSSQAEKSTQIPLMRDIYATAKATLVWIGNDFPGAREAFEIFPYLSLVGVESEAAGDAGSTRLERTLASRPAHGSIIKSRQHQEIFSSVVHSSYWKSLRRYPDLDDDAIFKFDDKFVWDAIHRIIHDSYFDRAWIVQEVAAASNVRLYCGSHTLSWDLFRMAYVAMDMLLFIPQNRQYLPCRIPGIEEVRLMNQSEMRKDEELDLAQVLLRFRHAKQTVPHDRIYAALGLVRPPSLCSEIVPDYGKPVEDVFCEAARHIIDHRKDLMLWLGTVLRTRRSMKSLPSWVPEWTMQPYEEDIHSAKAGFCADFPGNPRVENKSLFVDGHLLDVVDATFELNSERREHDLIAGLGRWLNERGKSLFGTYADGFLDGIATNTPSKDSVVEANELLREFNDMSPLVTAAVCRVKSGHGTQAFLNIMAVWSVLESVLVEHPKVPKFQSHHLFLAILYLFPIMDTKRGIIEHELPQSFDSWILAAALLLMQGKDSRLFSSVVSTRLRWVETFRKERIRDRFFVTRKGLFGMAPDGAVERGQVVALLGGAYTPYLLEREGGSYRVVSHSYVEGVMEMGGLPPQWKLERVEIR